MTNAGRTSAAVSGISSGSLPLARLLPAYNERALLVGKTGSGKTHFASRALNHYPWAVVLDVKGRLDWPGWRRVEDLAALRGLRDEDHHVIYRPSFEELADPEALDSFFFWVYKRGNTMLYVDEVLGVASANAIPLHYLACVTRGRELGVGVISATQRPVRVPAVLLSEADAYYVWQLRLPQDRARIEEMTGERLPQLTGHAFAYYRPDTLAGWKVYQLME
jgi:DNA helicase HerA-like ATPase